MIEIHDNAKEILKEYERYISIYGNLYLAKRRKSKNLINIKSISEYNFVLSNDLEPNTTYSLSFTGGPITYNIRDGQGGTILLSNVRKNKISFTTSSNGQAYFEGSNGTFPLTNFMLVEGNKPLPYEEYDEFVNDYDYYYENRNKNLFDIETITEGLLTSIDGRITYQNYYFTSDFIKVETNVITIMSTRGGNCICYDSEKKVIDGFETNYRYGIYHLSKNTKYIKLCERYNDVADIDIKVFQGAISNIENYFDINDVIVKSENSEKYVEILNNDILATKLTTTWNYETLGYVRLLDLTGHEEEQLEISFLREIDGGSNYLDLYYGTADDITSLIYNNTYSGYNFSVNSDLGNENYLWCRIRGYSNLSTGSKNKSTRYYDIQITNKTSNVRNGELYQQYNSSPFLLNDLTCKILSFNMNEKVDLYYTSLQHNTLEIEVDNQDGYFTTYYDNNIINNLNSECYIDLFIRINANMGYQYKIGRFNFEKLNYSDYEKAKLSFTSCLDRIPKLTIKDKYKIFNNENNTFNYQASHNSLQRYMYDNYKIMLLTDGFFDKTNYVLNDYALMFKDVNDIKTMLIYSATKFGIVDDSLMIINNKNNDIIFKTISDNIKETIKKDYMLEKPSVKKDSEYKLVKYSHYNDNTITFIQTNTTYKKTITDKIKQTKETLVLIDNKYKLSDISINDITYSDNITFTLEANTYNIPNILVYTIEGNIGEEYTIQIEKNNISRYEGINLETYNLGKANEDTKILKINENSCIQIGPYIYLFNKKSVKTNVELKIMALPYLELGDTINVELDNKFIKIVITEIDTDYDGGLIQTIKGCEIDWGDLIPNDNLYPSDDLYPY